MSQIGIEGFDANRNAVPQSPFDAGVASNSSSSTPYGTGSAGTALGLSWTANSSTSLDWNIGSNEAIIIQGAWHRINNSTSGFSALDVSTIQVHLDCNPTNRRVQIYRGSGTTNLLAETADNALPPSSLDWVHVGWEVKIDPTVGYVKVWIDGLLVLNVTGLNTRASANTYATVARLTLGANAFVDHYFAFSADATAPNTWPGVCRVYTGFPTSDASVQFTPNAGATNFTQVDDADTIDGSTTYNASSTAGHIDRFGTNLNLPSGASVICCEVRSVINKDDVGTRTGRAIARSGGSTQNGTTLTLTTTFTLTRIKLPTDPNGGGSWTDTAANALQPGYEIVS